MTQAKWGFLAVVVTVISMVALQNILTAILIILLSAIVYKICTHDLVGKYQQVLSALQSRVKSASDYYYRPVVSSTPPQESVISPPRGSDATIIPAGYVEMENEQGMLLVQPMTLPPQ